MIKKLIFGLVIALLSVFVIVSITDILGIVLTESQDALILIAAFIIFLIFGF